MKDFIERHSGLSAIVFWILVMIAIHFIVPYIHSGSYVVDDDQSDPYQDARSIGGM